jgi:asparagine synthase (glutamine-hydrolysing)
MQIALKNNKGFSWYKNESVFIKGYFFDPNNIFYQEEKAVLFLNKITTKEDFINTIKEINGCFTIIIKSKKNTFIASDTTRSFPIFYTYNEEDIYISDDISFLKEKCKITKYNKLAELEFKASLHTYGKKTLLQNVFQVQSNEYLIIENNQVIKSNFFFSYATEKEFTTSYNSLKEDTITAFENAFQRLITSLDNKPIALPLSGGFDSRFIAVMLKKYNYKNVVCFTYGRKDSFEIENSKKTAEVLGFKWYFIEYNSKLTKGYLKTKTFRNYAHFAGKYSSMSYLQEYFAVIYLKENHLIDKNTVFIPGFAGDVLGGSQFIKVIPKKLKSAEIIDLIFKKMFRLHRFTSLQQKEIKDEIKKNLLAFNSNYDQKIPATVIEDYNMKERLAKFIFNSASFYTFFEYQHRFPFWDKELLEFFKKVPQKDKQMKALFDDVLINNYFKPFNVYFEKELGPDKKALTIQKIKDVVKPILPRQIKHKILQKHDWSNYKPLTDKMSLEMAENGIKTKKNIKEYNEIIAQWYLHFCKEEL